MNVDSSVYAASIVKVARFCLDGKLAGASCVTGPDLKRRLEMILKTTILTRFTGLALDPGWSRSLRRY
jgi:hypothetical protein